MTTSGGTSTRLGTGAASEGAYAAMHRTKPQTLGYGVERLAGRMAAWIVEKFRAWSDCGGDVERASRKTSC